MITHVSPHIVNEIAGGVDAVVGSMAAEIRTILAPAFTSKPLIIPSVGPPDNGLEYQDQYQQNAAAEFYYPDMPVDQVLGPFAETLRRNRDALRSSHPLLSFSGIGAEEALQTQTIENPFGPIQWLAEFDGDVLLVDLDHTHNFSIHYAEKVCGRKQFTRWALTPDGIIPCPDFPGCSDGFNTIQSRLSGVDRRVELNGYILQAIPLRDMINLIKGWTREDPRALLCDTVGCRYCSVVRSAVRVET